MSADSMQAEEVLGMSVEEGLAVEDCRLWYVSELGVVKPG